MKIWDKIKLACSVKVARPAVNRSSEGASPSEPARQLGKLKSFDWLKGYQHYVANRKIRKVLSKHFDMKKINGFLIIADDGKELKWQIDGPLQNNLKMLESLLFRIHQGLSTAKDRRN